LGIVDNYKVWTAAFKAEVVDAEVFDSAVEIRKSVLFRLKLRGSVHELDE